MSVTMQDLVAAARASTARRRAQRERGELERRIEAAGLASRSPGRFRQALSGDEVAVIAEVKGASPVDGTLRAGLEPAALAGRYAAAGGAAISVLTEERFFGGCLDHLEEVTRSTELPVLRKDFIVEHEQVLEAALAGAAAVLLIAEVLDAARLAELTALAHGLGLDALVEIHDVAAVESALASGSGLVGVNNRDLSTMRVDPTHCLRVAEALPGDWVRVAESGIRERGQVRDAARVGYDAVLVGSSLVTAADPAAALRGLVGVSRGA